MTHATASKLRYFSSFHTHAFINKFLLFDPFQKKNVIQDPPALSGNGKNVWSSYKISTFSNRLTTDQLWHASYTKVWKSWRFVIFCLFDKDRNVLSKDKRLTVITNYQDFWMGEVLSKPMITSSKFDIWENWLLHS
jgi:hypothetical protein